MKQKDFVLNASLIFLYVWALITSRFGQILGLSYFTLSENIILNFTPIYSAGAFLWAIILSIIKLYRKDKRHYKLDLAIVLLVIYAYLSFNPYAIVWNPTFLEVLALIFIPFMTWLGTLTWAIILLIYRIYLFEQKRNLRN